MALNGIERIRARLDEITKETNDSIRRIFIDVQERIIDASPVAEENGGNFRNRWIPVTFGPQVLGKSYKLINTAPYANVIEYGGFTTKPETEMTIGGYSKQAPQGIVRVNLEWAREEVKKI